MFKNKSKIKIKYKILNVDFGFMMESLYVTMENQGRSLIRFV